MDAVHGRGIIKVFLLAGDCSWDKYLFASHS